MNQKSFWTGVATGGGVVAVIAAVIFVVVLGSGADRSVDQDTNPTTSAATAEPTDSATSTPQATTFARLDPDDPMAMGEFDAPVLMIEWADLRCHYCGVFTLETLPTLVSEYVDAGLLRIEWHSASVLGGTSTDAAVAARAAGQQGLFWEFIDALYATGPSGATEWTQEALVEQAATISGMDVDAFTAALSDESLITAETTEAAQSSGYGVTGTPMFIINDQVKQGAALLEEFRAAIDAQLSK